MVAFVWFGWWVHTRFLDVSIQFWDERDINSLADYVFTSSDILAAFTKATQYANNWAKAWHKWALFNTAVMSHYTVRGFPEVAAQFVVAAVTGYFHSIACGANAKGVDDSLQVCHIICCNIKDETILGDWWNCWYWYWCYYGFLFVIIFYCSFNILNLEIFLPFLSYKL